MKLEDIGFYTLEDARALQTSSSSPLWRCELILTDSCNFACPYCRGIEEEHCGQLSWARAASIVEGWALHGLRNIRFSGGEPTLWKGGDGKNLIDIVAWAKACGIGRVAISTNGSVSTDFYMKLVEAGANDFSISLDACCAQTGDKMAGDKKGAWTKVAANIEALSKVAYVTAGVVFTEDNIGEFLDVVAFADSLGVADIRVLSSAQWNAHFENIRIAETVLARHPILRYRVGHHNAGRHVRGLRPGDAGQCPLVLDDMAILNGKHFPCIIYLREQGAPIGSVDFDLSPNDSMIRVRQDRARWFETHDTGSDPICSKNCLDVCIDYNNKVKESNPTLAWGLSSSARAVIPIHRAVS